ncbi:MAG: hypothetical protein ACQESF_01860 [Nanobdellota archaeon]
MWKKLVNTWDVVVYERKYKEYTVNIEARLGDKNQWHIFKKYSGKKNLNHIEHYMANSTEELQFILKKLMKKSLSAKEIENIKLSKTKQPRLSLKRDFKEYGMEKWRFSVDGNKRSNLVFIKFDETVELDIILHETYKEAKDKIISELSSTFNLENQGTDVEVKVYYYNDTSYDNIEQQNKDGFLGKLEIGYDVDE